MSEAGIVLTIYIVGCVAIGIVFAILKGTRVITATIQDAPGLFGAIALWPPIVLIFLLICLYLFPYWATLKIIEDIRKLKRGGTS